jgi:hypothetical protein
LNIFPFSHRLQNETKILMQQTNDALQELNNTRVLTEADQVRRKKRKFNLILSFFQRRKKTLTENLPKQYLATLNRFQEAQRIGARKEKESLDRARAISFRQQGMSDSPFADNFVPTPAYGQFQQQAVLPMEQEVDMRALRERDEQLRELEV